jgi:hypothetical protein
MTSPFKDGWTIEDMEEAIERNNPDELLYVPVWVSMEPPDCKWAEKICIFLSDHPHFNVRGNAILGFGHLARTCGALEEKIVKPIIEKATKDENEYVRGQAECAVMDTEDYLDWNYK